MNVDLLQNIAILALTFWVTALAYLSGRDR